jgi:hypothetical protein
MNAVNAHLAPVGASEKVDSRFELALLASEVTLKALRDASLAISLAEASLEAIKKSIQEPAPNRTC